ncbi:hypothetical protein [Tessaracoccus coleopterorum]|uniref:hypothetical protein n=1 Tax=Tessaracoccus coleopterorum TaxID=2714950 RepID=UPI001E60E10D|nr:hypothetical protein [Tessaracoccus coleopterorum]
MTAATAVTRSTGVGGFFAGNDGGVGALGPLLIWASGSDQLTADRSAVAFLGDPSTRR